MEFFLSHKGIFSISGNKLKHPSLKFEENESQSIVSGRKSTSHHNIYINNGCKNNKFELLLQSLFDIINPITDICLWRYNLR
jgi:hypothetical protein